ncbi:hypothetical protein PRK78_003006 [Emydomyces testavorans]|uniref:Vacuolar ATPase assembly protein VMA22 n=1 Tax=Emydomyces testavorans TaxID=2070801 RepID=A0AAF0IK65_9EURO|nr:hypothetical protein PRK78_003006 [Emydomyces testavorans]
MDETLPTPPLSPAISDTSEIPDSAALRDIDDLLEQYLYLLDEHQRLQNELGKHLSAVRSVFPVCLCARPITEADIDWNPALSQGFFALACANRSSPPGRRYGEDYYDERMKAIRKVTINSLQPPSNHAPSHFEIVQEKCVNKNNNAEDCSPRDSVAEVEDAESEQPLTSEPKPVSSNPLYWFGVLVPAALRDAQKSFVSVIEGPISALANVTLEMREVEQKVEDLRKVLVIGT